MDANQIATNLTEGTILEGPFFDEPVRVLLAKARGDRLEVVAEGVNSKQTWKKLIKVEDFESSVTVKAGGGKATLDGDARKLRLAAEARRTRLSLTEDEWIKAQRLGKDHWLYIVTGCKSNPVLNIIQDPAAKLTPSEAVKIVRYVVARETGQAPLRRSCSHETEELSRAELPLHRRHGRD